MSLEALIFDVDGTLAETEELHRQAFNRAFQLTGLNWHWDRDLYAKLLETTGGKERISRYIEDHVPGRRGALDMIPDLHATKTEAYLDLLSTGALSLRPGVERLIGEARAGGIKLAIATTTTPANVAALLRATLGAESLGWFVVAAGDMVPRKKPDPAIYMAALERLAVEAPHAVAFEDSANGIQAALAAGLTVVATPSLYLAHEELSASASVVSDLGEPNAPLRRLSGAGFPKGHVDLEGLRSLLAASG